ncbi:MULTISPECIES: glycosyl-4,4'-diaponeurosporenoate acyltransferase [Carnobacterium]|uniref:Glycosyl-4,4'-diaponeurosporenoate acyltransferase n=1 Tax=Carnobacterium inhibens TaxID=147709 RepID=A0ABR7TAE5_9LACT|nr:MULTISPECIES: glycosyl-4,4'-diaponeurosporenoate acyltransferase [Carnobacterium]MBC9824424.1 glycosyl-4,4'-diaponeurosporenoate acyltransferase [Carnobacterium inhibens]MDN5372056.1 glycosyl-4,4-diaponeurosporenoate acyltransferase [Carnobacterium sp.]
MQLIELSVFWTIITDSAAWLFFHLAISIFTLHLPKHFFLTANFLYRTREWEAEGQFWQTHFNVKKYAKIIPEGSRILGSGFYKRRLKHKETTYLETFILETKRAELTHWLSILPSFLFFLWNPAWAGWVMVSYALLFNIPIIIVQRYNRPRLEKILARKKNSHSKIQ